MMVEAAATVFIVDDDPHVRGAIQRMLKSAGLRSESFGTPQEFTRFAVLSTGNPACGPTLIPSNGLRGVHDTYTECAANVIGTEGVGCLCPQVLS